MNTLDWRIKKILDAIIDVAYADEPSDVLKRLHGFKLRILSKELKSSSGMYTPDRRLIEVYNPHLGDRYMAKCCIHELSHHVDYMLHDKTGHQKPFYEAYKKLAYASMDMDILSVKDFYYDTWSSDQNKVRKIMDGYIPHHVEYEMPRCNYVCVRNGYEQRDALKKNGYYWNSVEQLWEKQVDETEDDEIFLKSIGCNDYFLRDSRDMHVLAVTYVIAIGNTYEKKELLKQDGFYFDRHGKVWKKKLYGSDAEQFVKDLKSRKDYAGLEFDYTESSPLKKS